MGVEPESILIIISWVFKNIEKRGWNAGYIYCFETEISPYKPTPWPCKAAIVFPCYADSRYEPRDL